MENGTGAFQDALQYVVKGKRDGSLADNPELGNDDAAEFVIMLETLAIAENGNSEGE